MNKFLLPATLAFALVGVGPAFAETTSNTTTHATQMAPSHTMTHTQGQAPTHQVAFASVKVNNQEVARLAMVGRYSPEMRAAIFRRAVETGLVRNGRAQKFNASAVTVATVGRNPEVRLNGRLVAIATIADARLAGMSQSALAQKWATELRSALSGANIGKTASLPHNLVTIAMGHATIREASMGGGAGAHGTHPMGTKGQMKGHEPMGTGAGQMQQKSGMGAQERHEQTTGKK